MSRPWKLRGYVVERQLGVGATGEVWRARVAATGQAVALKRLHRVDGRQLRHLHAEAALLSALEHPNLIRLHAVLEDGDSCVLVLDLAEGGSLADLLAARGRLTPGEVVTALTPVASALAYAHGQGVVHGDVSPANVLFTGGGVPLLADLGVARLSGDDAEADSTPGYLDPAVAAGCVPGPASDVFMLGGVALHALTGRPTWPGRTAADFLAAARVGTLEGIAQRLRDAAVPVAMAQVLQRALSSDARSRGNAADFALDLRGSAEPVAVEFSTAGRPGLRRDAVARGAREAAGRPSRGGGGRHAAVPMRSDGRQLGARLPRHASSGDAAPPSRPPPTAAVGLRPRPALPGRRVTLRARRGALRSLVVLAVVAAALAAVWLGMRGPAPRAFGPVPGSPVPSSPSSPSFPVGVPPPESARPDASSAPPGGAGPAASQAAGSSGRSVPSAASSAVTSAATSPATRWARVLRMLDSTRARAFAARDGGLLRSVYASAAVARADSATLARIVPSGCGLFGARTRYTHLHVVPRRGAVVVTATAALRPAALRCGASQQGATRPAGPVRLRIVLVRTRDGPRISAERQLG